MSRLSFQNRDKEKKNIINHVKCWDGTPTVFGVRAPSAWGKSRLTEQSLLDVYSENVVRVSTVRSSTIRQSDGIFLLHIAKCLDKASCHLKDIASFEDFTELHKDSLTRNIGKAALEDALSFFKIGSIGKEISSNFSTKRNSYHRFMPKSVAEDQILAYVKYVDHVISTSRLVLVIENIQSIDDYSLDVIGQMMEAKPPTFIIAEHTIKEGVSTWDWDDLKETFIAWGMAVDSCKLGPLPDDELPAALGLSDSAAIALSTELYQQDHGNLRRFEDLLVRNKNISPEKLKKISEDNKNPTKESILSISNEQRHLFSLIVTHWGSVEIDSIYKKELYPDDLFPFGNVNDIIEQLQEIDFIEVSSDMILVKHSSLSKEFLKIDSWSSVFSASQRIWRDFYRDKYKEKDFMFVSGFEVLSRLIYFNFSVGDLAAVVGLVEDMASVARRSSRPTKFLEDLREIRKRLNDKGATSQSSLAERIDDALIDIYYAAEDADSAFEISQNRQLTRGRDIAYRAMLLDRVSLQKEAIQFCVTQLQSRNVVKNSSLELFLKLVMMISYHNLGQDEKAHALFNDCLNKEEYKNLTEYGFLLRNSQIIFSAQDSIKYIKKSIEFFKERSLLHHKSYAMQTLAVKLGNLGRVDEAKTLLLEAKDNLSGMIHEHHTIDNNLAVLGLLNRDHSNAILSHLRSANLMAKMPFSRVVINNNIIIYHSLYGDQEKALPCIDIIEKFRSLNQPSDMNTWRLVYYNISKYWERYGRHDLSDHYRNKSIELPIEMSPFWRHKLLGENNSSTESFMAKQEFRPIFLTHWFLFVGNHL